MNGAAILEGDIAIVRIQPTAEDGDIVVARFEDETTVKYLRRGKGGIVLAAANEKYEPIPAKGAQIIGKVIGVVRHMGSSNNKVDDLAG